MTRPERFPRVRTLGMLAVLLSACALPCAGADTLDQVLSRMDAAARDFKSYSADVTRLDYDHLFQTSDTIKGVFTLKRVKKGILGNLDFTEGNDHYIIHIDGDTVEKYLPNLPQVQIYSAKQFASTMDETLLLGFAVPRAEMERDYKIQLAGTETVSGKPATHLILTPKSAEALKAIKSIELWIPQGEANPIQQKGNEPSGDYKLAKFSNLKVNPTLPDSDFELKVPPGVPRIKAN